MALLLFGGLTVTDSGGAPVTLQTRKTALVLVLLAQAGNKGAGRETLAEWIWPDRSDGQARTSLRQALASIRKVLPKILAGFDLESELDVLRLTGPDDLIDFRRFEALRQAPDHESPGNLVDAAGIYTGDLLENLPLPAELESFVQAERQRFRQHALVLVETLSQFQELDSASRTACDELANRLLAVDPAAEEAHRAIIRLRLAEGQTNAARRQFERCAEAVAKAFDAEPEDKTRSLLDVTSQTPPAAPDATGDLPSKPEPAVRVRDKAATSTVPSVVVMPFDDLGGTEDDFFVDGVVEEITSALSRIHEFFVIARQSAYTYKGRFVDVREVGRDLGVRYAVEGTVRRGGNRVRITVQLVETANGTQLWSERYEGDTADLFDLQDRIASHVAGAINPSIRASEIERARRTPPENLQAYDLFLRGLPHFWTHRKEDNLKAIALFDQAIERDPEYGPALAFKAWCHAQQATYLWADEPARERAASIAVAKQAALCIGDHATGLVAIGASVTMTTTDFELASSFIERSLAIDPNNAWGWMRSGWLRAIFNVQGEALDHFDRALELSPFDPLRFNVFFGKALVHAHSGDIEMAIDLVKRGLREGSGVVWAYRLLAAYYQIAGEPEKSAEAAKLFVQHYPNMTIEKMKQGVPPSIVGNQPFYWEAIRKTGIPER